MGSTAQIARVVEIVRAVEAKRIDFPTRYGVTFFSENDVWLFDATLDSKVCKVCRVAEEIGEFRGNNLRLNFPYWEIIDENTILPHVHPNCRCVLKRVIGKVVKV